ncbi:SIR2 family protein [Streptobacillus ratti]|uniref:SIR2 family protein n=1 Tax=Streptobacillus ratti TaxID=1720557 RepID=UPI0009337E51|nr:SIR2 family protein [Streptobacillus ratti]
MNITINRQQILDKLYQALNSGELSVFVGAGISKGAGYFDWKELLKEEAKNIKLDVEKERDLTEVAQYICNAKNRGTIDNLINKAFPSNIKPNDNHLLLAKLPIDTFWTTNYDKLIEKALDLNGKTVAVKSEDQHLQLSRKNKDVVIYKMHGDIEHPNRAVITRDDYEKYGFKDRVLFRDILEGDLLTKTFLFIGFSFTDPNFLSVLSKMRILLDGRNREHYCILKEISKEDYPEDSEYSYEKARQELAIEDLKRYGIFVHLIQSYSEITDILDNLYKLYRRKTIFISGSAADYSPITKETAIDFIQELSYQLVRNGYTIINGYGEGVGTHIINGVTRYCYTNRKAKLGNFLTLMPFPLNAGKDQNLNNVWIQYRTEMIEKCGVAIFIFGNKLIDEKIVKANGMREEFCIAENNELVLLPIGFTGSMASELAKEIKCSNINEKFIDVSKSVEQIIKFINEINGKE